MLNNFSLHFIAAIALYAVVLVLGLAMFLVPAVSLGLAGDPMFGFTLLLFLSPLFLLLYYVYYMQHSEVKSHMRLFTALFMALTIIAAVFLIIFILPWAV